MMNENNKKRALVKVIFEDLANKTGLIHNQCFTGDVKIQNNCLRILLVFNNNYFEGFRVTFD